MPPVVFFMLDGVRPDALAAAHCPNVESLRARGSWTLRARSMMPSITLPCHMSIFHSVPPTRHGITSNTWMPMARPLPGLVEVIHAADKRAGFVYDWEPLRNLSQPERLAFSYFRDHTKTAEADQVVAEAAARYLAGDHPDFLFVYFGTVDSTGHSHGWMSPQYLAQLERVDAALGTVLNAWPDGYAIVLQADHGGHDRGHGTDSPEDMTIPWLAAGPGIRQNYEIKSAVSLLDTTPTIARLLGLKPHGEWEGKVVEEIFGG
jgi:predicted AlkP superfamily pyrophosphatase or phosphodiesterase